jgi:hypothetical protein
MVKMIGESVNENGTPSRAFWAMPGKERREGDWERKER